MSEAQLAAIAYVSEHLELSDRLVASIAAALDAHELARATDLAWDACVGTPYTFDIFREQNPQTGPTVAEVVDQLRSKPRFQVG